MSIGTSKESAIKADTAADDGEQAKSTKPKMVKLYFRGVVSNSVGLAILYAIAKYLNLTPFVVIALGIQYLVFFAHGLPQNSEKFYDLSGSFTHLSVVLTALVGVGQQLKSAEVSVVERSPRQLFAAAAAIVWMTRLGTFLYNRILKDGKDGRFDAIKPCWLSFCGAWTVQAVWVTLVELPVILLCSASSSGVHAPLGVLDIACMCGWVLGFLIEACADSQKMQFRSVPDNKEKWSQDPDYVAYVEQTSCLLPWKPAKMGAKKD